MKKTIPFFIFAITCIGCIGCVGWINRTGKPLENSSFEYFTGWDYIGMRSGVNHLEDSIIMMYETLYNFGIDRSDTLFDLKKQAVLDSNNMKDFYIIYSDKLSKHQSDLIRLYHIVSSGPTMSP